MLKSINEGLEKAYESVGKPSMTVGTKKVGDLDGYVKAKGPAKSGAECTDAKKAEEAPKELQGETVASSTKKTKGASKFDELYTKVVKEEALPSIESDSFDTEAGDFPPAGEGEDAAGDNLEDVEADEGGQFSKLADLFTQIAAIYTDLAGSHGDAGGEETLGLDDAGAEDGAIDDLAKEAVEMEKAPDSVGKLTSKGNMNVKGVKVVKQTACSKSSGAKNGGKPETLKDTNLGPKTPLKANGCGPAVDGKGASFFG